VVVEEADITCKTGDNTLKININKDNSRECNHSFPDSHNSSSMGTPNFRAETSEEEAADIEEEEGIITEAAEISVERIRKREITTKPTILMTLSNSLPCLEAITDKKTWDITKAVTKWANTLRSSNMITKKIRMCSSKQFIVIELCECSYIHALNFL